MYYKLRALSVSCLILLCVAANAQQKTGYVNSVETVTAMPEFTVMNDSLQRFKDESELRLKLMYAEYQTRQNEIQKIDANPQSLPDSVVEEKIKYLQDLQQHIQDYEAGLNNDYDQLRENLLKPIKDKYTQAVKEVSAKLGYTCVLDLSSETVLYFNDEANNITTRVKEHLGIKK